MISALIDRRGGNSSSREDVLTHDVLGAFRYLDRLDIAAAFLGCAKTRAGDCLEIKALKRLSVSFWPPCKFGESGTRVPDAVIILELEDKQQVFVVLEAKFESGPSDRDINAASEEQLKQSPIRLGNQLADEFISLYQGRWPPDIQERLNRFTRRVLLYVTGHYAFPTTDYDAAIRELGLPEKGAAEEMRRAFPDSFFWLSWRELYRILEDEQAHGFENHSLGQRVLLKDLFDSLAIRNLNEFRGFRPLESCDGYQSWFVRMMWHRRLLPVDGYQRIWGGTSSM